MSYPSIAQFDLSGPIFSRQLNGLAGNFRAEEQSKALIRLLDTGWHAGIGT
ncbi:hypothetical protein PO883_06095 [Massilia sp. DJPM01]|uniref:hypothetical protein n=1 Tax=Massilia sp. DJPM01 TaxID=3024404 RepID=UPI00259FC096|nr:hypothetical protein [Massilia sp. DJPM01]MDM5176766.1 hypothetical protein [Massilia sp. DJPM01]